MDEVKDLGVIIDSDLSFHSHINNFVTRAFIRSKLITLLCVTQYPHINANVYCLCQATGRVATGLVCVGQIKRVESVQSKFTKWLPGFRNLDYRLYDAD